MSEILINTSQNVNISFTAANVGDRIFAYVIDYIFIIAYLMSIFWIAGKLGMLDWEDNWSKIAVVMTLALPAMFYTLISEIFMNGQTLGKKIRKIKVVKIDGFQATNFDFFTRWIFRLIDIYFAFGTGIIAVLSISLTKKAQRLGDMATGTTVISIRNLYTIKSTILENISENYKPMYPSVINLSDNDIRIVKDYFKSAIKNSNYDTIRKLRIKVEKITKTKKGKISDMKYLTIILKDYTYYTQNM